MLSNRTSFGPLQDAHVQRMMALALLFLHCFDQPTSIPNNELYHGNHFGEVKGRLCLGMAYNKCHTDTIGNKKCILVSKSEHKTMTNNIFLCAQWPSSTTKQITPP